MNEKKIVVPEGMLDAFRKAETHHGFLWDAKVLEAMLTAALRWLAENPMVPSHKQVQDIAQSNVYYTSDVSKWIAEWQRRMFLAPEPEVRQFVKDAAHSFQAVTLTEAEFRYLMDFVDTHGVDRAKAACRIR
jgi:hypothetical protein